MSAEESTHLSLHSFLSTMAAAQGQIEQLLRDLKKLKTQLDLMDREILDPAKKNAVHQEIRQLQTKIAVLRYQGSA